MPFLPDVIQVGQFPLSILVLTGLAGVAAAYFLAGWTGRRARLPDDGAQELLLDLVVGAILGAKLYYVAMDPVGHLKNPLLLLLFPQGPRALPMGLGAGLLYGMWRVRKRSDWRSVLDAALTPLTLAIGVGLLGWKAPGTWAFGPLVALAGLTGLYRTLTADRLKAGMIAAEQVVLTCLALVLADLGRPVSGWAGATALQLAAATGGTLAWFWQRHRSSQSANK